MANSQTHAAEVVPAPPAVQDLTIVCSWCKTVMHQGTSPDISHGICLACRPKLRGEAEAELEAAAADTKRALDEKAQSVCLLLPGCTDTCPDCEKALADESEAARLAAQEAE